MKPAEIDTTEAHQEIAIRKSLGTLNGRSQTNNSLSIFFWKIINNHLLIITITTLYIKHYDMTTFESTTSGGISYQTVSYHRERLRLPAAVAHAIARYKRSHKRRKN